MGDISYFRVYGEYLDYFRDFDLYDLLFDIKLCGGFAIGAAKHVPDEGDIPAGLMIVGVDESGLTVKWLYVAPGDRGRGIGTRFMELAYMEASGRGFDRVYVRITDEYINNGLEWMPEIFFYETGFTDVEPELPEWSIRVADLYDETKGYKHPKKNLNLIPVSDMKDREVNLFYEIIKNKYSEKPGSDPDVMKQLYDPQLSYACLRDKELTGFIINARSNGNIYPIAFHAESPADELTLASSAIEMSEGYTKARDTLRVKCKSFRDEELMRRLSFASEPIGVMYYTADVNEMEGN